MRKLIRPFIYRKYMNLVFFINNVKPVFWKLKKSYSDYGEDLIIEELIDSNTGSYIDIGAGHPIIGSNTYYFYKKGWQGITIEPIKFHNRLHKLVRRRDKQIKKLVSETNTRTKFYEFNPTQYSTNSIEHYREMIKNGMKERRSYYLNVISINQILSMVKNSVYFLSIDCEGYDSTIIKSIRWEDLNKPRIIVFERISEKKELENVELILLNNGYKLSKVTNINYVYLLHD
jgi:FkbM family methyltransferase